jgi:hypothetical protein
LPQTPGMSEPLLTACRACQSTERYFQGDGIERGKVVLAPDGGLGTCSRVPRLGSWPSGILSSRVLRDPMTPPGAQAVSLWRNMASGRTWASQSLGWTKYECADEEHQTTRSQHKVSRTELPPSAVLWMTVLQCLCVEGLPTGGIRNL